MKIIVAGGGTGGHIIPNIALLQELEWQCSDLEIIYVGAKNGMEKEMIPSYGWKFVGISCGKLRRYFSWENFVDLFRTGVGIVESLWIVARFKPEVIFCKGGYVSLPVAIAGGLLRKPVIIHESDVVPGLANKIAAHFAKVICVSFEQTKNNWPDPRLIVTGNPVRKELAGGDKQKGLEISGFKGNKPVILIMGGSQGAQFINKLIWENLKELLKHFQIIHICGKNKERKDLKGAFEGYFSAEFIGDELKDIYAASDLIISRSGANSLAEIAYLDKPAILIPLVQGSRGDQISNAQVFAKEHLAEVLDESKIAAIKKVNLSEILEDLLKRQHLKNQHKSNKVILKEKTATKKIVEIIKIYEHKNA